MDSAGSVMKSEKFLKLTLQPKKNSYNLPFGLIYLILGVITLVTILFLTAAFIFILLQVENFHYAALSPVLLLCFGFLSTVFFLGVNVYRMAWRFTGKEIILVTRLQFVILTSVAGLSRRREFPSAEIKDLRLIQYNAGCLQYLTPGNFLRRFLRCEPTLAFSIGSKQETFACNLGQADAEKMLEEIRQFIKTEV